METTKIYGPPGTGKTTTLISTLGKELRSGTPITEVAYLTHTRAGADEVKSRIGEQFSDQMKKDLLWFRTIHSACCKLQGIGAAETIGYYHRDLFYERYGYKLDGRITLDMSHDTESWDKAIEAVSIAYATKTDLDEVRRAHNITPEKFYEFLECWEEFKQDLGMVDFVDQLKGYDNQPLPVKVMIIDEAQDLSKRQWDIVNGMSANCERMYIAGDDDQSIYGFIGADEYGFLDLKADKEIVLEKSYRVPRVVGDFAAGIIAQNTKRKEKHVEWSDKPGSINTIGSLRYFDFDQEGEIFILARHNRQCKGISEDLIEWGIPHSVNGESLQQSPIARVAKTYLELLTDESVSPARAARVAEQLELHDLSKRLRTLSKLRRPTVSSEDMEGVNFNVTDWTSYLSNGDTKDLDDLRALQVAMNQAGSMDIIGRSPRVSVMTYHYSKGREADIVILMTDCYTAAWDDLHTKPQNEIRLCYVGATRTKRDLVIVQPESNMSMKPLLTQKI